MAEQSFTTYFTAKGVTGAFTDPFYPWIEYSYCLTTGGCAPKTCQEYPVSFHMKNVRSDGSQFSGVITVEVGVGGKEPTSKCVKYDLGEGDYDPICGRTQTTRFEKDTIYLMVKHVIPPNIEVYNPDITHSGCV